MADGSRMMGKIYSMMEDSEYYKVAENEEKKVSIVVSYPGKKTEVYTGEVVARLLLKNIRERAEKQLDQAVISTVIAVPATMDTINRESILKAATQAGFEKTRLVNNTTAVATTFRLAIDLDIEDTDARSRFFDCDGTAIASKIVVFDLGARGLNVSVVGFSGEYSDVLATCGDPSVGGEHILLNLIGYLKKDLASDKQTMMRLRAACEKAMVELESSDKAMVILDGFEKLVSRKDLETMNKEMVKRCKAIVEKALGEARINTNDVKEYLLIGCATNTWFIKKELTDYFDGKKPCKGIYRGKSVSVGACIQAVNLIAATDDKKAKCLSVWDGGRFKEVSTGDIFVVDADGKKNISSFQNSHQFHLRLFTSLNVMGNGSCVKRKH